MSGAAAASRQSFRRPGGSGSPSALRHGDPRTHPHTPTSPARPPSPGPPRAPPSSSAAGKTSRASSSSCDRRLMAMMLMAAAAATKPLPRTLSQRWLPRRERLNGGGGGGRWGWSGSWSHLLPLLHPGPCPPRSAPADVARPGRRCGGHVSARRGWRFLRSQPGVPLPGSAGSAEPPVSGGFGQRCRRAGPSSVPRSTGGWTWTILVAPENVEFEDVICETAANKQALCDVQVLERQITRP